MRIPLLTMIAGIFSNNNSSRIICVTGHDINRSEPRRVIQHGGSPAGRTPARKDRYPRLQDRILVPLQIQSALWGRLLFLPLARGHQFPRYRDHLPGPQPIQASLPDTAETVIISCFRNPLFPTPFLHAHPRRTVPAGLDLFRPLLEAVLCCCHGCNRVHFYHLV